MILFGICTTPDTAIDGMVLLPGAIDCQKLVPLFHNHEREIGRVWNLQYNNGKLLVTAETDDPVAAKANFMSPAVKAIEYRDGRCSVARLIEISLTNRPQNPHCRILERHATDPIRELCRGQEAFWTLTKQRVDCLQRLVTMIGETKEQRA